MIEKKFKRLPCGISNFERLISENYCYVDKTRFIEVLENEANKNQFFIRPRKFGKTLFFSMLGHYYDINSAKNFDKLFGDLYIGKHPTPLRNSYLVMKFNFSGMDTSAPEKFTFDFNRKIINTVLNFFTDYRNLIPDFDLRLQEVKALNSGSNVMEIAYMATKSIEQKIFIIIDEYDHFANDLIAMGKNMGEEFHKTMIQANGLVRDFYETLKIATESVLNRIFITGISPVMLDDLTSGFNIVDNLTLKQKYNEMLGFTQQEVDALMVATGVEPSLINVDMKAYFDGYLFNENGANRVYNPSMILYFFNQLLDEGRKPQNIIDDNLQTDYGRLRRLTQNERNRELLIQIVKDNGIASKIIRKFSIDTLNSDDYFISLLFYMGLLTIKGPYLSQVMLGIPNYAIKTVYWEYISCLVQETSPQITLETHNLLAAISDLALEGNLHTYIDYVSQNAFSKLSDRDLMKFDEKYIKILLLSYLFQSNIYIPMSEYEAVPGYTDIFLQRNPNLPQVKYEWVLELKYCKAGEEKQVPIKREEGLKQINRYITSHRLENRPDIKAAVVVFIGKDQYEITEI